MHRAINIRFVFIIMLSQLMLLRTVRSQWISEDCPSQKNLNAICFTNNNSGWIIGNNGIILKKTGNRWLEVETPTTENLKSIYMLDNNDGWIIGERGIILHYNGILWEKIKSPTGSNLLSVKFRDNKTGIAVGENGTILTYENHEWKIVENNIRTNFFAADFWDDEILLGGGLEFVGVPVMKLNQSHEKVISSLFYPNAEISDISIPDQSNVWMVGGAGTIIRFDGENWTRVQPADKTPTLRSVIFSDLNNGICAGLCGTILTFSGDKWERENSNVNTNLNGTAITANRFYAVGDLGTIIYKEFDPKNAESHEGIESDKKLKIFPIPCYDHLNLILYDVTSHSEVTLSVSTINGKTIIAKKLLTEDGCFEFSIKTNELTPGIYFLKLTEGNYKTMRKFIVKK